MLFEIFYICTGNTCLRLGDYGKTDEVKYTCLKGCKIKENVPV